MSILSSSKVLWMFFNLHWKITLLDFQLIIILTVAIQVAVLNRFSWNSLGWFGSTHGRTLYFLETIDPMEPQIWGKMCPQNWFFGFHSAGTGVFDEKISNPCSVLHFLLKRLHSFLSSNTPFSEKWTCSPKHYFLRLFWKILFFVFF